MTESAVLEPISTPNVADVQRRTLTLLFLSQIAGGVGIAIGSSVAALLAADMWLSDRFGRRRVIVGGVAVLLVACAVAGTAGHDATRLAIGLMLLGLGWSGTMVAGSALLSESMSAELRPSAQGLSDLVMGLSGASEGALSGVVVQSFGYPTLTLLAALMTGPLAALIVSDRFGRLRRAVRA